MPYFDKVKLKVINIQHVNQENVYKKSTKCAVEYSKNGTPKFVTQHL